MGNILPYRDYSFFYFGKSVEIHDSPYEIEYHFIDLYRNKKSEGVYYKEIPHWHNEYHYNDDDSDNESNNESHYHDIIFNCFIFLKKYLMAQIDCYLKIYQITEEDSEFISEYSLKTSAYKILENAILPLLIFYEKDYCIISEIDKNYKIKEKAKIKGRISIKGNFVFYKQRLYYFTKKDLYVFD